LDLSLFFVGQHVIDPLRKRPFVDGTNRHQSTDEGAGTASGRRPEFGSEDARIDKSATPVFEVNLDAC